MKKRVIITDYLHNYLEEQLREMGFDVDVKPEMNNEQLLEVIGDYTGLVHSTKTIVNAAMIEAGTNLRFIARAGSGLDNIDVKYAASKNIAVLSAPEANANAVAEHALGMLLSLLNNIVAADREVRSGFWNREPNRGSELDGKIVGLIGFGNNGAAFARKLRGFDVEILAYDKYKSGFGNNNVRESTLEEIQTRADIISLHVPLTDETMHMVNGELISNCKKPFWLINTSRGKVVDTSALVLALESGKIKGAALDVLENENLLSMSVGEKLLFDRLTSMKQIILTPHVAGWSKESYFKISKVLAEKIRSLHL